MIKIDHSIAKFNKFLLKWYNKNKRNLPFREKKDPYSIWISEIMLQQTRVNAMLASYSKFIFRFPDIESLANADEEEVLRHWKGLGYYSRAINLLKGAKYISENHSNSFPKSLEEALKIPGVGQYTARAVLSISYDVPIAVLDGNVKRVLSRVLEFKENIDLNLSHKKLQEYADNFLNQEDPSNHNQAMMELGAMICLPNPTCAICPVQSFCKSFSNNTQLSIPLTGKEKKKIEIELIFRFFESEDKKVLLIKEKSRRFFKKVYSPPFQIQPKSNKNEFTGSLDSFLETIEIKNKQGGFKHSITNHSIKVYYAINKWDNKLENNIYGMERKWVKWEDLGEEFPSSLSKKILKFRSRLE